MGEAKFLRKALKSQEFRRSLFALVWHNTLLPFIYCVSKCLLLMQNFCHDMRGTLAYFVVWQLEKQHSPLLKDLMSCLKEVMKDYRSEVQDVLSADRQLANEIEFDLKRFEEQQKEFEEQRRKQNTPNSSPQVCTMMFFL